VNLSRLSEMDILQAKTDLGESILQLTMCGDMLSESAHMKCLVTAPSSSIESRITLLDFFKEKLGMENFDRILQEKSNILSAVQAFSLMSISVTPESGDAVNVYMSNMQDAVVGEQQQDVIAAAVMSEVPLVPKAAFPTQWTPLHCAILANSNSLLAALLGHNVFIAEHSYVHFVAGLPSTSSAVTLSALHAAAESSECEALLNGKSAVTGHSTPLHVAVACQNVQFVDHMLMFDQVNVNAVDEDTQRSAFFESVVSGNVPLAKAFITSKSAQVLDLNGSDVDGKTCIEQAINNRDTDMIEALSYDFASLCVEKLACVGEDADAESLLMMLELENIGYCEKLGITAAMVEEVEVVEEVKINEDEEQLDLDMEEQEEKEELAKIESADKLESGIELDEDPVEEEPSPVLTDPEAIEEMKLKLAASDALMSIVMGMLQEANVVAKDGHAHECFFAGQLYDAYCEESHKVVVDNGENVEAA